jgi:hypothetical protein
MRGNGDRRDGDVLEQLGFDFTQLDAMAADFHLTICAPDETQQAIIAPAHQIAGAIHPAAISRKWVCRETLLRKLWTIEITLGDTGAADIQLANRTGQHGLAIFIEHIEPGVEDGPANRWRRLVEAAQFECGRPYGGFRRAVELRNARSMTLQTASQFRTERFTAHQCMHAIQFRFSARQKHAPQRWRGLHVGGTAALNKLRQQWRIAHCFATGHHHLRANGERQIQFESGNIEDHRSHGQKAITCHRLELILHTLQEIAQIAMSDFHTLGPAGGT